MEKLNAKNLVGKRVVIVSDNENYDKYKDKELIITHSQIGGVGYDSSIKGEALVNLVVEDTQEEVPFSLYEYEFKKIGESKLQKAAKPKESKLSKAFKTAKSKTIETAIKAEEKAKELVAEKKSEMDKYIKVNDLKKFSILEFTKNGKMMKIEKAVRGFNIEDNHGKKNKIIIYHYTPELEEFLTSNKIKATVFDSKEELDEWLKNQL